MNKQEIKELKWLNELVEEHHKWYHRCLMMVAKCPEYTYNEVRKESKKIEETHRIWTQKHSKALTRREYLTNKWSKFWTNNKDNTELLNNIFR